MAATAEDECKLLELCKSLDQTGVVAQVRELLKKQVSIDCSDKEGVTPLMNAAFRGNEELCKLLLEKGADINSTANVSGYTVLMFAVLAGHVSLVQFLLQAGARTDVTNLQGKTVLDLAAFVGQNSASRIIRNYISLSDVEYYSVPQGLETAPKLLPELVKPLHCLLITVNIHPVKMVSELQKSQPSLLEQSKSVCKVLDLLAAKLIKKGCDKLSFKSHYLSFIISQCIKLGGPQELTKRLLTCTNQGAAVEMDLFLRQCVKEYPGMQTLLLRDLVAALSKSSPEDQTALSMVTALFLGDRPLQEEHVESCFTCGAKPSTLKKCAKCKKMWYCGVECQRTAWTIGNHKAQCKVWARQQSSKNIKTNATTSTDTSEPVP